MYRMYVYAQWLNNKTDGQESFFFPNNSKMLFGVLITWKRKTKQREREREIIRHKHPKPRAKNQNYVLVYMPFIISVTMFFISIITFHIIKYSLKSLSRPSYRHPVRTFLKHFTDFKLTKCIELRREWKRKKFLINHSMNRNWAQLENPAASNIKSSLFVRKPFFVYNKCNI